MSDPVPLTRLKREAEKLGHRIDASYRKIYGRALDGKFPADQINGRWHVDRSNIPAIADTLSQRRVKTSRA
jgi:hypothetical protein